MMQIQSSDCRRGAAERLPVVAAANKRMGYIDAMRGFTMVLVVFSHALIFGYNVPATMSLIGSIFSTFRMPLFFFVSGFFAYRAAEKWTLATTTLVLKKKFQAQVIGTLVFYALYKICFHQGVFDFLTDGFRKYWFTVVLFQMFLIYLTLALVERWTKVKIVTHALYLISILLCCLHSVRDSIHLQLWTVLDWGKLAQYFQYFAMGILVKKYYPWFICMIRSAAVRTIAISLFFAALLYLFRFNKSLTFYNADVFYFVQYSLVGYAGLMTVFCLFYRNRAYFESGASIARCLRYIGQRTLEIYMLHYFFIPSLRQFRHSLTGAGNTVLLHLAVGMAITIPVIAICLLLTKIIRMSPLLAEWLFAVKVDKKAN